MFKASAMLCVATILALELPAGGTPAVPQRAPLVASSSENTTFGLPDGSHITISPQGMGERTNAAGLRSRPVMIVRPQMRTALESNPGPSDLAVAERIATARPTKYAPGEVIVTFRGGMNPNALGDVQLARVFKHLHAGAMRPMFARSALSMPGLPQSYVLRIASGSPLEAARELRSVSSIAYASPDYYVGSFKTDPVPIPTWEQQRAARMQATVRPITQSSLPANYGLTSSLQSFLNANSVDAAAAFSMLGSRFGQLPGTGERITNVSLGDLTDASMAANGDPYVQFYGPTTIVQGGQRYLDLPSMPLIPTYTADMNSNLNPLGSVEHEDPFLAEIMLDFSVMAPLPHNLQRGGEVGSGDTDLLGIAPGAQYELVVPQQPTFSNIDSALIAAATQVPRPNVITASLGFGTDNVGFPGRYLEDDPLTQAIVSAIVKQYGIVVCIASNDGTRLFTNEPVNPDGGSTPTDVIANSAAPTNVNDDAESTTPTEVFDSGAIAAGGSTLDDIFAAPPAAGGQLASQNAFAETRLNGALNFSSGFGSRVNVSAPGDNIPSFVHFCTTNPCTPDDVLPVLEGGTSASAPEIAAASAVVLQAARLSGRHFTPADVRALLERTGRVLPAVQQVDLPLNVGPQLDLANAVESLIGSRGAPSIARVAVAERQNIGGLGGEFVEATDPGNIDLAGPTINSFIASKSGANAISPITIAPDWQNIPFNAHYQLTVSGKVLATTRWARLLPAQILAAAGMPLVSTSAQTVTATYDALFGRHVITSATFKLTFLPTDGTIIEAQAPLVSPTVNAGNSVTVRYDISNVRPSSNGVTLLQNPELIVSSIGHWSPISAPYFRIAFSVPLTALKGSVTIPASVFAAGGGVYGVGILQYPAARLVGDFAPFRVEGTSALRPAAPTLSLNANDPQQSHTLLVTRAQPQFSLHYNVSSVHGASGAMLEISAPGPTLTNLLNVFSNAFGTERDANGIDAGSVVYQPLLGTQGTVTLDVTKLNLASSLQYTVRVLATNGLNVVGEASPVSSLDYTDSIAPGGAFVSSFDISPSGTSTVGTLSLDSAGNILQSSVIPYQTATETYLTPFISDTSGQNQYFVFGSDPKLKATAAIDFGLAQQSNIIMPPPQKIMTIDDGSGQVTASASIDPSANEFISGAIVDGAHDRLALLTDDIVDGNSKVIPYALQSGSLATPIQIATRLTGPLPNTLDIDQSTSQLYATAALGGGDNCFILRNDVISLNIDTAAATVSGRLPGCIAGIASDQSGGNILLADGSLESVGHLPGFQSQLIDVSETTLAEGTIQQLPDRGGYLSAVDPANHLLLEGFVASNDLFVNNNAMSAVDVLDSRTGALVKHLPTFGFLYPLASNIPFGQRGIQVDPTTRTAWTYGPSGDTVQQFSY